MEFEPKASLIRKVRLGQLEPELQKELLEFASEIGYESTVKTSGRLDFLWKFYQAEKVKERRSKKMLKKAENLILRLESLRHEAQSRELERQEREKGKERWRVPSAAVAVPITVSERMRKIFESIGIEDEKTMAAAIELLGEPRVETRVELIHASEVGGELAKKVFSSVPERLLVADDDQFLADLSAAESKKEIIDSWGRERGLPLSEAAYQKEPSLLFEEYHEIARLLELKTPESLPTPAEEGPKYRGKPMEPDDFGKVVMALGFSFVRKARHGDMLRDDRGNIIMIGKPHQGGLLGAFAIKKKLEEAGVDLKEFEEKRMEMRL